MTPTALPVMPTRILVVGGGGREHALAWKLGAEPGVNLVLVAPGGDAIAEEARTRVATLQEGDRNAAIVALARREAIELVVVGPEQPLAEGLVDALEAAGILTFGPTAAAARIESSKAFCHEVAAAAGVRMAASFITQTRAEAEAAIDRLTAADGTGDGFVVKEDGLAAGKGVAVFDSTEADRTAAGRLLDGLFATGRPIVVIEERLSGPEASVIALCDGRTALALPAARDYKRLLDGDAGPNTGGMGAYSPLADLGEEAVEAIVASVHRPILAELARRGTPFRGALYAGLMLTADGPALLECNARFGDPETQVILPRLAVPLGPLLRAAAAGALPPSIDGAMAVPAIPGAAVGIVLAGGAYPGGPARGDRIDGLVEVSRTGALVFHAGSRRGVDGRYETDGGRILTVVGRGPDIQAARAAAEVAADTIEFAGRQRRHDIAAAAPPAVVATGQPVALGAGAHS